MASAKLANRKVNHSHKSDAEDEPRTRLTLSNQRLNEEDGGEHASDEDDEHDRILDLVPDDSAWKMNPTRPAGPWMDQTVSGFSIWCSVVIQPSSSSIQSAVEHLQLLDDRAQRQCRHERQRSHHDHHADQQHHKQRGVSR